MTDIQPAQVLVNAYAMYSLKWVASSQRTFAGEMTYDLVCAKCSVVLYGRVHGINIQATDRQSLEEHLANAERCRAGHVEFWGCVP